MKPTQMKTSWPGPIDRPVPVLEPLGKRNVVSVWTCMKLEKSFAGPKAMIAIIFFIRNAQKSGCRTIMIVHCVGPRFSTCETPLFTSLPLECHSSGIFCCSWLKENGGIGLPVILTVRDRRGLYATFLMSISLFVESNRWIKDNKFIPFMLL